MSGISAKMLKDFCLKNGWKTKEEFSNGVCILSYENEEIKINGNKSFIYELTKLSEIHNIPLEKLKEKVLMCGIELKPILIDQNIRNVLSLTDHYFKENSQQILNSTIENNFTYHAPKGDQPQKYQAIRSKCKELAYLLEELVPQGREKEAMTHLENVGFWANAGIARV